MERMISRGKNCRNMWNNAFSGTAVVTALVVSPRQ
jgi:hypothetical protein